MLGVGIMAGAVGCAADVGATAGVGVDAIATAFLGAAIVGGVGSGVALGGTWVEVGGGTGVAIS